MNSVYLWYVDNRVDIPFRLAVKQSARGVEVHHLLVNQGTVAILGVFPGSIPEEPAANGFLKLDCGFSTGHNVQFVPRVF